MNLSELIPTLQAMLLANDTLKSIPQITELGSKSELEAAIQTKGLALVFIQESGALSDPKAPDLLLSNMVIVSVLENPKTNATGITALDGVGQVLKTIHQADWGALGLRNALTVDSPAYTRGELESGLTTYFCNFRIKTIE